MLTLSFIIIPFIGALLCLFPGKQQVKSFALYASLLTLVANVYAFTQFANDVSQQFLFDYWWVKDLGISFKIGVDGISILLVTLTNVLVPLIILSSFRNEFGNAKAFYALVLIMQAALRHLQQRRRDPRFPGRCRAPVQPAIQRMGIVLNRLLPVPAVGGQDAPLIAKIEHRLDTARHVAGQQRDRAG